MAAMPVKSYSTSPKKGVEEKKHVHMIINITYSDNTPFGWAFKNFYDAKDFVKYLSNRNGKVTIFGGMELKPFSNLTTNCVKSSMLGNLLWIIPIDTTKNGTEDSFPMQAHLAFANKITQAITCQNISQEGGIDVVRVSLNESQVADLTAHFSTHTFDDAREAIFQEAIKLAKEEVESLILFHSRTVIMPSGVTPDSINFHILIGLTKPVLMIQFHPRNRNNTEWDANGF
jgi:hypothetical protein